MQPTATNLDQSISFTEDVGPIDLADIVVADTDPGEVVTATLTLSQPAAGALTTSGDATYDAVTGVWSVTGSVTEVNAALAAVGVDPAADWEEGFSITTRIRDAADTGPGDGLITFSGTGVNDAPEVTGPATIDVVRNVTTDITGLSFADVDADPDAVTVTLAVPQGTLQAASGGGVTVGGTAGALTLSGTIADINAFIAGASVTYAPAADATGDVNLTVTIDDGGFNGSGGAQTDTEVVVLEVRGVNTAPTLDNSLSPALPGVSEDAGPPVDGSTAGSVLVSSLLGGAADVDGDTLGVAIEGISAHGSLWYSLDDGDTWTLQTAAVGSISRLLLPGDARIYFQPDPDFSGAIGEAIGFRAWDQSAGATPGSSVAGGSTPFSMAGEIASIGVSAVNDAPEISGVGSIAMGEGLSNKIKGFAFSDADAGSNDVTVTLSVSAGVLFGINWVNVVETGSGTSTMTLTGALSAINQYISGNLLSYSPSAVSQDVVLSVSIDDHGAAGAGGSLQASKDIIIEVRPQGKPEPPPPEVKVIDGVEASVRETEQAGKVIREIDIAALQGDHPGSTGDDRSLTVDERERIMATLSAGTGVALKTPVDPTKFADLLPTLQLALGQHDEIATGKAFAESLQRLGGLPDDSVSVISVIIDTLQDLQNANAALVLEGKLPGAGGGLSVVTIDVAAQQAAADAQIAIALQNITMAIVRGAMAVIGGLGPQIVFADGAAQRIVLGEGDDELHGGGGDDVVGSESGNDTLAGDEGLDTVFGGEGHDQLSGGTGADHLHGNLGSDLLHGGEGADTLYGGQGDDAIAGGKDDDLAFGDLGNDIVYGDLGSDLAVGGEGDDFLHGNLGDDTIEGGSGADLLHGGQGADVMTGGDGADTLSGDLGDDVLSGGAGADLFLTYAGGGTERILDFDAAEGDRLRLEAGLEPVLRQVGADTVVDLGSGGQVILEGVQLAGLPEGWMLLA